MEDAQIVQLYWERDELAISATADKYGPYCTAIAKNILGVCEDTDGSQIESYAKVIAIPERYTHNAWFKSKKQAALFASAALLYRFLYETCNDLYVLFYLQPAGIMLS